jgi:superfamily II DNA or RNA helicase
MAVRIPRSALTTEQLHEIRRLLRFQPEDTSAPRKGKVFVPRPQKEDLFFFSTVGDDVLLPYTFGNRIFKKNINFEKNYPITEFNTTKNLYSHQIPIAEEALSHLENKGTTVLGLPPGSGKTVYGAVIAAAAGLYTCVLIKNIILADQWLKTFQDFTDATVWIVPDAAGLKKNPVPEGKMPQVTICMLGRYAFLPKEYRESIGVLIIDEAHSWCIPTGVDCLLAWEPKYVVAETATLVRQDQMHQMMQVICGLHGIFKKTQKSFTVYKVATGYKPEVGKTAGGRLDYNGLLKDISNSEYCNQIIVKLIKDNSDRKVLVLTRLREHVDILMEMIQTEGIKVDYLAGNKKNYTDSDVLIGTISKIGTGFDEKNACKDFGGKRINMVILASSIKDEALLEQSVGRGFRSEDPIIVDIFIVDEFLLCSFFISFTCFCVYFRDSEKSLRFYAIIFCGGKINFN